MERSQISRLESGKTSNVNSDMLVDIAKLFHISTDYLLGLSKVNSPKSYEISQLGLSEKAVRRLLTGKFDTDIVNRLMEHDHFPYLCQLIRMYFDDTIANGIMARNQIIDLGVEPLMSLQLADPVQRAEMLKDRSFLNAQKIAPSEADIEKIKDTFMKMLRDIKKGISNGESPSAVAGSNIIHDIKDELSDKPRGEVSFDDLSGVVADAIATTMPMNEESKDTFKSLAKLLFEQAGQNAPREETPKNE